VFRWGYVNTEKCSIFLGSFKCTGLGVRFYICKAWGLISDMVPLTWSSVCNTDLPTDWVKITRPLLATRWSTQCNNWSLVVKLYSPKPIYTWFKTIMKNWILCSMPWLAKKKNVFRVYNTNCSVLYCFMCIQSAAETHVAANPFIHCTAISLLWPRYYGVNRSSICHFLIWRTPLTLQVKGTSNICRQNKWFTMLMLISGFSSIKQLEVFLLPPG